MRLVVLVLVCGLTGCVSFRDVTTERAVRPRDLRHTALPENPTLIRWDPGGLPVREVVSNLRVGDDSTRWTDVYGVRRVAPTRSVHAVEVARRIQVSRAGTGIAVGAGLAALAILAGRADLAECERPDPSGEPNSMCGLGLLGAYVATPILLIGGLIVGSRDRDTALRQTRYVLNAAPPP